MKKLISILFLFHTPFVFSQVKYLIPFRDGNLWGYSDMNLKIIVTPKYDYAGIYSYGFGLVGKGKLLGYLNTKGEEIVTPMYDNIGDFWNKYVVVTKGKNNGIIHTNTGKVKLAPIYDNISYQGNNFFIVSREDGKKGLFNAAKNSWLLAIDYNDITFDSSTIQFNYYTARKESKAINFFLDNKGKFSLISIGKIKLVETKKKEGLLLTRGEEDVEYILEIGRADIDSNNTWIARSFLVNGKLGFSKVTIKNGLQTTDSVPAIFDDIRLLLHGNNELLLVKKNGKEGIITTRNQVVIPLMYDEIKSVDSTSIHEIYIVKMNGRYGLVQKSTLLLECKYDKIIEAHESIEGFHLTQNNKAGFYIFDKKRSLYNILIEAQYDYILGFHPLQASNFKLYSTHKKMDSNVSFLAYVSKNAKRGYIGLYGKEFFKN